MCGQGVTGTRGAGTGGEAPGWAWDQGAGLRGVVDREGLLDLNGRGSEDSGTRFPGSSGI